MNEHSEYMHWRLETDDEGIAWLYIDKAESSANVLSKGVLEELNILIDKVIRLHPLGVVILSAKNSGFIAGADIKEFTVLEDEDDARRLVSRAQTILERLENLPFPTVAVIHGYCLGGGLELALACRYRIADDDPRTKLGLPEVKLGIHPGFGGTVRLTQLIGGPAAMDLMLTGRNIDARTAKKLGIIDHAVPQRQLKRAATTMIKAQPKPHQPSWWQGMTNHAIARPFLASMMRKQVAKKARPDHYPAPYALIDLWADHADIPKKMFFEEARSVAHLVRGQTAQNLIRVFFLQEQLKAQGRESDYAPKHVHIIGAGVMGGDIAIWCAMQGLTVTIQDRSPEKLARLIKRAHDLYKKRLKLPRPIQAALDRLTPDFNGHGVRRADVIIEAIIEDVHVKQSIFKQIEAKARPDALLATNTSSIPLETIGEVLIRPDRLVGLHFFNPVAQMQLVEIVSGSNTNPKFAKRAAAFARRIDRLPLPVKSAPGFLVNRVLMPYLLEAVTMVEEGIPPEVIDQVAVDFGMPMGPIALADTVGLDICLSVAEILSQQLNVSVPQHLRDMVKSGKVGRKNTQGFYSYENGQPIMARIPKDYPVPADLADRLMFRMFNEAMTCLNAGVVENADLLDAGIIFGTGFAPFRGGPMHYIKQTGLEVMRQRLQTLDQQYGKRFSADPQWSQALSVG